MRTICSSANRCIYNHHANLTTISEPTHTLGPKYSSAILGGPSCKKGPCFLLVLPGKFYLYTLRYFGIYRENVTFCCGLPKVIVGHSLKLLYIASIFKFDFNNKTIRLCDGGAV